MSVAAEALVFFGAVVNGTETDDTMAEFEPPASWGELDALEWEDVVRERFKGPVKPPPNANHEEMLAFWNEAIAWHEKQQVRLNRFGYLLGQDVRMYVYIKGTEQGVEWGCTALNTDAIYGDPAQMDEWPGTIREWCETMDLHLVSPPEWQLAARYG